MEMTNDGSPDDHRRKAWLATLTVAIVVVMLGANAAVFAVRAVNVYRKGAVVEATGTERTPLYGVWKAQRGYPVYETPFRNDFPASLYNFAFYKSYGAIARVFGWRAEAFVLGTRLTTTVFSVVAVLVLYRILIVVLPDRPRRDPRAHLWAALAATVTVFSSAGVSWFTLTTRPDVSSMVFALLGLTFILRGRRTTSLLPFIGAAVWFAIGWSFKQSTIGILGGACCWLVFRRRWGQLVALAGPFVVLVAACLVLGSDAYRENTLVLPGLGKFRGPATMVRPFLTVIGVNAYLWIVPFVTWFLSRFQKALAADSDRLEPMLRVIAVVTLGWCLLTLSRDGGERNSLLEAYLAMSVLSYSALWHASPLLAGVHRRAIGAGAIMLTSVAIAAAFPVAQLVLPNYTLGDVTLGSDAVPEEARLIAAWMATQPKPMFVEYSMLAEPWYATNDQYPSVVLDAYLYLGVKAAGRLPAGTDLAGLIASRRFPVLLVTRALGLDTAAMKAGYREIAGPPVLRQWALRSFALP
jgi:hypothetical protein